MRRHPRVPTERLHLWLMLPLTFSTGAVDAVGYLGLDRVFTGNMTRNVPVLLRMSLLGQKGRPAVPFALTLASFMFGALCAGRLLRNDDGRWTRRTSLALLTVGLVATGMALALAFIDVTTRDVLGSSTTSILAFTMGIQAATAKRLKVAEITTVAVTSTITGLASESWPAGGKSPYWVRRALAIVLILLGAATGAAALLIDLWVGIAVSAGLTLAST